MGRPALNMEATMVRLPATLRERIKALAGTYGMAKWIRDAIEEKLARDEASPARQRKAPKGEG